MAPVDIIDDNVKRAVTLTDHDALIPVADHSHLSNSSCNPSVVIAPTCGNDSAGPQEGSSPSSVMAGVQVVNWIAPSCSSCPALLPDDTATSADEAERPRHSDKNGESHESSGRNLDDRNLDPSVSSDSHPGRALDKTTGNGDGSGFTQRLNHSPDHSSHIDLTADALGAVPPQNHSNQYREPEIGGRGFTLPTRPDDHDSDSTDVETSERDHGDLWNLTITGLAEKGKTIASEGTEERLGTSRKPEINADPPHRSPGVRFAHGTSPITMKLPVSWGGVATFRATIGKTSSGDEMAPPPGAVPGAGPSGTSIVDTEAPTTSDVTPSNPFETHGLTLSLQPPPFISTSSSSSDWDWISDHARGTSGAAPKTVADVPSELPLQMAPQISSISFDDAPTMQVPPPPPSPSALTSPYSRSGSTKSGITTHSAETERRDNSSNKPKGSAVTTHSAETEPRRNTSPPAGVHSMAGGAASHESQPPRPMARVDPPPPPSQVVASWERSLAISPAASGIPGLSSHAMTSCNTSVVDRTAQLPATRLSNVICRAVDVAPQQNHPVIVNLGSTIALQMPQVDNTKRRLDRDHRYSTQDSSMAVMDDSATDFGFQQEASFRKHPPSWHLEKEKRSRRKNLWVFILTVSFVVVVTVTASVIATRSGNANASNAPSDTGKGIQAAPRPEPDTGDPASVSPPLLINASAANASVLSDSDAEIEWQSSHGTPDFGKLVALNDDGSIIAMTERLSPRSNTSVVHIVPRNTTAITQSIVLEAEATSLALNANGTILAVGLQSGLASAFELDPSSLHWVKMGEAIVPPGVHEYQKSSLQPHCKVSVSLSADGDVIALGLVTPYNVALFQVMKFDHGTWSLLGPSIQIGDDGTSTHVAASVALSSSCTSDGRDCILTTTRMFQSERFLFGMVVARELNLDQSSWDPLGQALPFSLEDAVVSLSHDGTSMAVSDAASTSVNLLSRNVSNSSNNSGTQSSWEIQGQEQLPKAYQVSLAGSGRRLALATAEQASVYDLVTLHNGSNETSSPQKAWNLTSSFAWGESFSATNGDLCLRISSNGRLLAVGAPSWPTAGNGTGRVAVVHLVES